MPANQSLEWRSTVFIAAIVLGAVVFALVLLLANAMMSWTWSRAVLAAAIYSGCECSLNLIQNSVFGDQRRRAIVAVMLTRRVVPLLFVLSGYLLLDGLAFEALGAGCIVTWSACSLVIYPKRWTQVRLISLIRSSLNYWWSSASSMLQQLDVPIISGILGASLAAPYAAAFRLASPVHLVTSILVASSVPEMTRATSSPARWVVARRTLRTAVGYAALVAVGSPVIVLLGPIIMGVQYQPYGWVFGILMLNSAVSVVNQLLSAILFAYEMARYVAMSGTLATLLGLCVTFVGSVLGCTVVAFSGALVIQLILLPLLAVRVNAVRLGV